MHHGVTGPAGPEPPVPGDAARPRDGHAPSTEYDRAALDALRALARECEPFSPIVGLDEGPEPEGLALDLTGLGRLFGGERRLAEQLQAALAARGLVARLAVADTLGGAWALARAAENRGLVVCPPGGTGPALARLPVGLLRVPPSITAWLAELGIHTIGQLAGLPRPALATRFGAILLRRWDQALGRADERIAAERPAEPLVWGLELETPLESWTAVEPLLAEPLERLLGSLRARHEGALAWEFRWRDTRPGWQTLALRLARPRAEVRDLLELWRLRQATLRARGPVAALELEITAAGRLTFRQQSLFAEPAGAGPTAIGRLTAPEGADGPTALAEPPPVAGPTADDDRALARLLERLSSRLGHEAVLRPRRRADPLPERAWEATPWIGLPPPSATPGRDLPGGIVGRARGARRRRPAAAAAAAAAGAEGPWPPRPLRLAPRPLPVEVVAVAPEGPPGAFYLAGEEHRLARHEGPERIESGWWRGRSARRDYYRVETAAGLRFWLFRELCGGHWFLHGWFD